MPVASTSQNPRLILRAASAFASTRWSSVAVAVVLAACAHSPQAAVQATTGDLSGASLMSTPTSGGSSCVDESSSRASLQRITNELQAQGMALKTACQAGSGGLRVQLQVVDGMKASKVVRGPLADGQEVDMGTPSGVAQAGAASNARGFSPDVLHNRVWLSELMARHQFENQPDAWWHFSQRGSVTPQGSDTDLASR